MCRQASIIAIKGVDDGGRQAVPARTRCNGAHSTIDKCHKSCTTKNRLLGRRIVASAIVVTSADCKSLAAYIHVQSHCDCGTWEQPDEFDAFWEDKQPMPTTQRGEIRSYLSLSHSVSPLLPYWEHWLQSIRQALWCTCKCCYGWLFPPCPQRAPSAFQF